MIGHTSRAVGGALALAVMLAACGGGGSGAPAVATVVPPPSGPSTPIQPNTASFAWGAPMLKQISYTGPVTKGAMSVLVLLNMNASGLVQYAQQANDPKSALYRHWLTPQQIGAQFGASSANYATVANYFASNGMHVGGWTQHEVLNVTGSIAQFQRAFGTSFGAFTFEGQTILAPTGTPHFSTPLPVSAVYGLVGAHPQHSFLIRNNNASYYGYSPQQLATGLDYSGAWNSGLKGNGINVGIIGTGPILQSNGSDADTAALASFWNANVASITQVAAANQPASTLNNNTGTGSVDNAGPFLGAAPPVTAPCNPTGNPNQGLNDYTVCNTEDGEAQLDTQSIASLAPGANVLFYLGFESYCVVATGPTAGSLYAPPCAGGDTPQQYEGIQVSDDEIQQAIADNKADALSLSYGLPENIASAFGLIQGPATSGAPGVEQLEFASLAAEGIAVFVSSGDDGAWDCENPQTGAWLGQACVSYPASDPNVIGVGGINIPLDESGNLTGQITAWADNTTLGGGCGGPAFCNSVGSGGGVSTVFTPPPWQAATVGSASMRQIPDISLDADPKSGPSIVFNAAYGGGPGASGGTSAAAPEAAAQWGIVLQACKASATCNKSGNYRLGNPAPLLYAIYGTSSPGLATASYTFPGFTPGLPYTGTFYDVIYGNNQAIPPNSTPLPASTPSGYNSGPGYDQVTGIGAPFTGHLIQAITGTTVP